MKTTRIVCTLFLLMASVGDPVFSDQINEPLTPDEQKLLIAQAQECWNVGSLTPEALSTSVTIGMQVDQSRKPRFGTIHLVHFSGENESAALIAFQAARRAVILCGREGLLIPPSKNSGKLEITFTPVMLRLDVQPAAN